MPRIWNTRSEINELTLTRSRGAWRECRSISDRPGGGGGPMRSRPRSPRSRRRTLWAAGGRSPLRRRRSNWATGRLSGGLRASSSIKQHERTVEACLSFGPHVFVSSSSDLQCRKDQTRMAFHLKNVALDTSSVAGSSQFGFERSEVPC
jgi:hypothetical protein